MDVGQHVRNLVMTPCALEQLKDADVGSEQIQVEMNRGSGNKCIREKFLGHVPA
jgi:hypothetical protein